MGREEEIRLIAYKIWEEEGCVEGYDCEHWYRAEAIWERNQAPVLLGTRTGPEPVAKGTTKGSTKITGKKTRSKKTNN